MDTQLLLMLGAIFLSIGAATAARSPGSSPIRSLRSGGCRSWRPARASGLQPVSVVGDDRSEFAKRVPTVRAQVAEGHGPDRAHARGRRLLRRVAGDGLRARASC